MPNYLDNIDVFDANDDPVNVLLQDRNTLALAQANANRIANLEPFNNKSILIIGDSLSDEAIRPDNWVSVLRTKCPNATITNNSLNGRWLTQIPPILATYNLNDYDYVIIFAGINDWINGVSIGSWGTGNAYTDALRSICSALEPATCRGFFITSLNTTRVGDYPLNMFRSIMTEACRYWGINWINGAMFPHIGGNNDLTYISDGLHPDSSYSEIMCNYILEKILSGGDSNDCDTIPYDMEIDASCLSSAMSNVTLKKMYFINGSLHFLLAGTMTFSSNFYTEIMSSPFDNIFNNINGNVTMGRFDCLVTQSNEIIPSSAWLYNNSLIVQHGTGKSGTADLFVDVELHIKPVYI